MPNKQITVVKIPALSTVYSNAGDEDVNLVPDNLIADCEFVFFGLAGIGVIFGKNEQTATVHLRFDKDPTRATLKTNSTVMIYQFVVCEEK
jgi:hypothetical protein